MNRIVFDAPVGPLGLEEITSYKYLVLGTGQARP